MVHPPTMRPSSARHSTPNGSAVNSNGQSTVVSWIGSWKKSIPAASVMTTARLPVMKRATARPKR